MTYVSVIRAHAQCGLILACLRMGLSLYIYQAATGLPDAYESVLSFPELE